MKKPKVSIIIPVFNGENYLKKAIDSALIQTYENIEIIVVNDGSTDKTDTICKSYGKKIKYYKKKNEGVASALNLGIKKMTGEYFAWLSHDDEYSSKKIELQVNQLSGKKNNVISVCYWKIIDSDSNVLEEKKVSNKLEKRPKEFLAFDRNTWLNGCAMLIHKQCFLDNGYFNENLKSTQDYDLWLRFTDTCEFSILNKFLFFSRRHSEQGTYTIPSVLNESDIFHSTLINILNYDNIISYVDNDISELIQIYNSFNNCNYQRTSSVMRNIIIKYWFDLLNDYFKQLDNTNNIKKIIEIKEKFLNNNEKVFVIIKKLFEVNNENIILLEENNTLLYEINNIKNSKSWKLTSLFRKTNHFNK